MSVRDLSEIAALFHVVEKAQGHPKLKAIFDDAMSALEAHAKHLEDRKAVDKAEAQVVETEEPKPESEPEAELSTTDRRL